MEAIIKRLVLKHDNKKIEFVHPSGTRQTAYLMSKGFVGPVIADDNGLFVSIPWTAAMHVIENGIYDMSGRE